MSRIIAGAAGGLRLASVPGDATRPTTDRVKESLFSKLESYDMLRGARVLDAYAGSGALGCEAASRGASTVLLSDKAPKAVTACRKNAAAVQQALGGPGMISVQQSSARAALNSGTWDLVFIDPPYALENEQIVQDMLAVQPHLAAGAIVVVERASRDDEPAWPAGYHRFALKKHGETVLYYVEPDPEADSDDNNSIVETTESEG